jgi:hypothetical protein
MDFKDLTVKHPYYCSDNNYYSNEASQRYDNWQDFFNEWNDADVEYNHVFRFDIIENTNNEEIGLGTYYASVFIMLQRKGIFMPCHIESISEMDKDSVIEFLEKHWNEVKKMWKPFS